MTRQEKIQLLKSIKSGRKTLQASKAKKYMPVRILPEGYNYLEEIYSKDEMDNLIASYEKNFDVTVVWISRGDRTEIIPGATPLTLNIQ